MKKLYRDDLAQAIKESGDKHYRPSNGTEGMMFMELFCDECAQDQNECDIIASSMVFDVDEEGYPAEWTFDEGQPCCTAFKKRE